MKRDIIGSCLRPLLVPLAIILLWELSVRLYLFFGGSSPKLIVLPPPMQIISTLGSNLGQRVVVTSTIQTLFLTTFGFCLGIVGAVSFGSLLGSNRWAYLYLAPSFHFFRSLPVVLYVPVTLVLIGSDIRLPILLSAVITILYGAVPVIKAVRDYDPEKILLLRARGYSGVNIIIRFVLPEIIAALTTSISIAITLALAVTVVAEMLLPSLGGLGTLIIHSKEVSAYDSLWAYTCLLGGSGFLLHKIVMYVWRFAVPWAVEREYSDGDQSI